MIVKDSKSHRSVLGKLLAREDITVNHGNYKTAFFDVKNRVLGLPDWSDKSKSVYDLLLGHEVGHALYTPLDAMESVRGLPHFDVINIVEDVRIERLIQKTYPGLPRYFKEGYTELFEKNFFGVDEDSISDLNFLDRLNLHAKIGSIVNVPLNDEELEIYNECYAAETFDDVMKIYQKIVDRLEDEKKEKQDNNEQDNELEDNIDFEEDETPYMGDMPEDESDTADDGSESHSADKDSEDDELDEKNSEAEGSDDESEPSSEYGNQAGNDSSEDEDFTSETQRSFDDTLKEETQVDNETVSGIFPSKKVLNKCLVTYKQLEAERNELVVNHHHSRGDDSEALSTGDAVDILFERPIKYYPSEGRRYGYGDYELSEFSASEKYLEFNKESKKKVGTLVREFERKKSAYQYSRAQISRSGKLDVNRIHSYKYDDNIFSSVTNLADAKSHGMIFLVDYSGSMHPIISGVLKQTLLLTDFCEKVGIPYEVYTFTDSGYWDKSSCGFKHEVSLDNVNITNPLSSKLSKKDKVKARKFMWLTAEYFDKNSYEDPWFRAECERFGGTPLDSTLLASVHLIDMFREKHKIQKLMLITLTDGESHPAYLNNGNRHSSRNVKLKYGRYTLEVGNGGYRVRPTEQILEGIKQIKDVTTIGFYIPQNSKEVARYMPYDSEERRKLMKSYRQNQHLEMKNHKGYDSYYYLNTNVNIEAETEFDPNITDKNGKSMAESRSSQTKLAKAFAKNRSDSRNTRVLLEKFAEMVA